LEGDECSLLQGNILEFALRNRKT